MPNTYSQLFVQIVFTVKGRKHFIKDFFREELQRDITGIIQNKGQKVYAIFCMPDHVHILVSLKPDVAISNLVRDVKANSSSFVQDKMRMPDFRWQEGFGAFSYSKSQTDTVVQYILSQNEHHRKKTFKEEYLAFLKNYAIDYDERYLFEFYD